ncbi:hypothetical protein MHF_1469 [Mycoplasma haemofelis Ohio2]|uniref:Uncharacterized protein n=1 Tax=Mycoplasma haemofelis (strain Ohio2) TaxID=859194 RepID=F6FGZ4_MYCHI|nr:hypothetical protein MHF_1469 [Mycoplasma haemofelis Ohio2]
MVTSAKMAASAAAAGGAGTAGYFIARNIQTEDNSIASKIDTKYLLKSTDSEQWKARVTTLKSAQDADITAQLKTLKDKGDSLKEGDLQEWCNSSLKSQFSNKETTEFKNILTYCAYTLGDKVTGTKITSSTANTDNKLGAIWTTIKGLDASGKMSGGLKQVKGTQNGDTGNAGSDAVKTWCLKQYQVPYYENESDLTESQNYCILK